MACVNNMPVVDDHVDSEREEGEIVDDVDDLSDISSEEEYLLRQRLQVLESYNHVLERKEAKRTSCGSGHQNIPEKYIHVNDKSVKRSSETKKSINYKSKQKDVLLQEQNAQRYKERRRKPYRQKKRPEIKMKNKSSDESDYEYRNKRRKLANAVLVTKNKTDTSLKARLFCMLGSTQNHSEEVESKVVDDNISVIEKKDIKDDIIIVNDNISDKSNPDKDLIVGHISKKSLPTETELINLSSDEENIQIVPGNTSIVNEGSDVVDSGIALDLEKHNETGSEEDLEILRQHALKSKVPKVTEATHNSDVDKPTIVLSDDEDSDTAELRLICLRSTLLKKAIEMKQKQKLRKKQTHSTTLYEDIMSNEFDLSVNNVPDNNTDIESVDMDIGSDGPDLDEKIDKIQDEANNKDNKQVEKLDLSEKNVTKEEDLEEDEDLLRAKLLTSLSKNLPLLVEISPVKTNKKTAKVVENKEKTEFSVDTKEKSKDEKKKEAKKKEEKRFIIHTGDSDSDGEHEVTKNLTKMHLKLSEQPDFQQKLDSFLKSTRMEVEKTELPENVPKSQDSLKPKPLKKFVPKTLNHLPKNEQIEYNNLVKRMAELEKIKKARQVSMEFWNRELNSQPIVTETLKPKNMMADTITQNELDEQIAFSRKKIAEQSTKVLQFKEEQSKLSQKYKIVATELRNISTAIAFNKKQQKAAQTQLSKIRAQHQILLKRCSTMGYNFVNRPHIKVNPSNKVQKENEPLKLNTIDRKDLKSLKVSVVNDFKEAAKPQQSNDNFTVQLDVVNNKKAVKMSKALTTEAKKHNMDLHQSAMDIMTENTVEKNNLVHEIKCNSVDDYQSPLQAMYASWNEDPNGVLCPFDVSGSCKDTNCKYLHPKHTIH